MSKQTAAAAKGLTTKHIVLVFGSLIIICAAVIIAVFLLRGEPAEATTPVATADNLEQIQGEIQDKVAKGMFMTHMNTTWNFPDGESASSNAVMGNSTGNTYPFWFSVTLPDTGEVIYQSGQLPVGQQLSEIKLDKVLDKGTYPAVINIHLIDENGEEIESNMAFNISLVVEK